MTIQLGECPGGLRCTGPSSTVTMALLEGNLAVQFKTLTQYVAVDCHRLENITIFEECLPNHVMLLGCLSPELDVQQRTKMACQLSQVACPCRSHFRKCAIIPGRPTPGRQQMPVFGDICYITLSRQSWLQGRFPCHVGPLAELCWNLEASHLQNTLTTVWGHLLVTSGFSVGSWPLLLQ